MVRLRNLHRAEDVTLDDSARPAEPAARQLLGRELSAASARRPSGCGDDYAFNATVTFTAEPAGEADGRDRACPAALGGGS